MSLLDALKQHSIIVADTGDIDAIAQYTPRDATTNPSLLLKASQDDSYKDLVEDALAFGKKDSGAVAARADAFVDKLFVNFGRRILDIIPGRVSTEVDARLSFDTSRTIDKARHLIGLYEKEGIDRERILIKVGATWEGIRAAEQLEKEGIHTNLTLLFSFAQAVACAEARVTLISPFVGRIYDWFKKDQGVDDIAIEDDPGVASVERIYTYFKKYDFKTEVMGASFRKAGQITQLTGCDLLTISPNLLEELKSTEGTLEPRLTVEKAKADDVARIDMNEQTYRWMHNEDAMAVEKLAEGIRKFYVDGQKLVAYATERVS
ncbi:MAG: transaldolase [Deltaproteobacteria bacterium]|jgi:transaldolase